MAIIKRTLAAGHMIYFVENVRSVTRQSLVKTALKNRHVRFTYTLFQSMKIVFLREQAWY